MKRFSAKQSAAMPRISLTLLLLLAAVWPVGIGWSEAPIGRFVIGVYKPAGWSGGDNYDRFFTATDATSLDNLGVNLLVSTPSIGDGILKQLLPSEAPPDTTQDLEEAILSLFGQYGGHVVEQPSEGRPHDASSNNAWPSGLHLVDFAGNPELLDEGPGSDDHNRLGAQVDSLAAKWTMMEYARGFFGYFIGHESDPKGAGGIYDSATYGNLRTVIDSIRNHDRERAIVVVGNAGNTGTWTLGEQALFRDVFFRSDMDVNPGPANILMNQQYILWCSTDSDTEVRTRIDQALNPSLDRARNLINAARGDGRKAEWYQIVNVNNEYVSNSKCWHGCSTGTTKEAHYRRPNLAELKAQANLALARGATGILYFAYTSQPDAIGLPDPDPTLCALSNEALNDTLATIPRQSWYHGLVRFASPDNDRDQEYAMYDTVKALNDTLAILGAALYPEVSFGEHRPLTWVDNYDNFSTDQLSASTLADGVRPSADHAGAAGRLEFGQFHDDEADYVLVVNRDSLVSGGSQTIDLRFDTDRMSSDDGGAGRYSVKETVTDARYTFTADAQSHIWVTQQRLAPGDARLYRIKRHPAGVPDPPVVTVVAGHERVTLSWTPGADKGSAIERHELRYSDDAGATWAPNWSSPVPREQIIRNLSNDTEYTFQMRAKNAVGYSEEAEVRATPRHPIEGSPTVSYAENRGDAVDSYQFRPPSDQDLSEVSYDLGLSDIDDSGLFQLDQGRVRFLTAPDFEAPSDADRDNLYRVWLRAAPAADDEGPIERVALPVFTKQVEVTVTNEDEAGEVILHGEAGPVPLGSSAPQVGVKLTPALSDPDGGISAIQWSWMYASDGAAVGGSVEADGGYTPVAADVGSSLRATVGYLDEVSADANDRKSAQSAPTAPVADVPAAPVTLAVSPGDAEATLSWTTPSANGSALTGYEVRQSTDGGATWLPDWTAVSVPLGTAVADFDEHTVTGLTNGTAYTFELRALNAVGAGDSSRVSATPGVPLPPALATEVGNGRVSLLYRLVSANGSPVTAIHFRLYRLEAASGDTAWYFGSGFWLPEPVDPSGSSYDRLFTHGERAGYQGLRNGEAYTFEARAQNGVGSSPVARIRATPTSTPLPILLPAPGLRVTAGDGEVTLEWSYTGPASVSRWGYRQQAEDGRWSAWRALGGTGTGGMHRVEELTNGIEYTFEVRGYLGTTAGASASASATPRAAGTPAPRGPEAPGDPRALGRDGAVALRWTTPLDNGSAITGYEVRQSTDGGSMWVPDWTSIEESDATTTSHTVSGLTNGEAYTFEVRAVNGAGPGDAARMSATPAGVTLSAIRGDGQVTLDWSVTGNVIYTWQYRQSTNGGNAWSGWTAMPNAGVKRSYVVGSLTNGVEYTFEVRAVDNQGSELLLSNAATATAADVPDPPEHLQASAGDAQVALRWETPSNNGSAITGYEVRYSSNGGSTWVPDWSSIEGSGPTTTSHTVESLTNGTRYTFAVRALNEVGPGGGAQVSATPSGVVLSALGRDGAVLLSWVYTGSASVTGWEVRQSTDGGSSWSAWTAVGSSDATTRSYPVRGLTNGVRYTFAVRGITGVDPVGSNLASATPAGVTLSALRGDGRVTLDWSVPDHAIYTWQYRQSTNGGNAWSGWTAMPGAGLKRSYVVGNLTNGVEYTFEVRAVDSAGAELLVSNAATVTPADVPDPPEHLEASAGDRRVVLRWETPSNNGAAITGYEVPYSSNGGMVWSPDWSSIEGSGPTTRRHTVVGLTNEVEYTLEVRALNEVGPGGGAQASATPGVDPLPVLSATGGDGAVLLSWVYTGSASVTGWEVRQSTDGGSSWSAWTAIGDSDGDRRSYPVTGLTNGVRYTFAVRGITGVDPVVSNAASATPAGVTLSALRGDGRVTLDWSVPDHAIYTWQYRQSTDGGNAWSGWTAMPNAGVKRSYVVGSLTNGVEYTFQVRAVDSQEAELLVSNAVTVTPADVPDPPENLRASAGDAQVALRWETPSNNGAEIMGYDYRQSTNGGSTWSEWTAIAGSGRETTTYTKGSLTNGTRYTFAVRALNEVGPGGGAQVSATPLPRAELSASRGDGRATLDWSVPGTVIYAWQYRQSTNGGSSWSGWTAMPNAGLKRTYVVRSLTNGTAYTFEVRAVDGEESGGPLSNAVTVTPAGRPGRPGNLQGVGGPERVALSWTASSSNGAAITGYEVRRRVQGSSTWSPDWTAIEGSGRETTSHTEEDLSAGTTYVFEVRARNDVGAGSAAGASATTDPSGGELTASRGDGRATLSWSVTSTVLYDWEYRQSTNGGSSWSGWTSMPHAGVKRSYVVTNLTNGVAYTFQVRALNSAGAAGPLSNAETVTPAGRPGQPEDLEAAAGDRRVALSWEAAAANGADITAYGVRWRGGGAWSGWATLGSSARSHTLGSLTNEVEHTFEVRAENEVGWGSAASVSARPREPLPPGGELSAYRGDGRATLSWSVTSHVVYDWEYRRSTNGGSSWSGWTSMPYAGVKRSYEVRGLTNGVAYTFQIRALNSAGAAGPLSNRETVTPAGRPGRPENLRASAGDRRVARRSTNGGRVAELGGGGGQRRGYHRLWGALARRRRLVGLGDAGVLGAEPYAGESDQRGGAYLRGAGDQRGGMGDGGERVGAARGAAAAGSEAECVSGGWPGDLGLVGCEHGALRLGISPQHQRGQQLVGLDVDAVCGGEAQLRGAGLDQRGGVYVSDSGAQQRRGGGPAVEQGDGDPGGPSGSAGESAGVGG